MKTFVQYGAGNIGRGFIGQLFSGAGYRVQFIDVNMELIEALNEKKCYPISVVSNSGAKDIWIKDVSGINGLENETVASAIASCDYMATAVGINIWPQIIPNLIAGFRMRIELGIDKPLNIIICENLIDADKLLHKLITEKLKDEEISDFEEKVGLVKASIGRMIPVMNEDLKKENILRVCVESYCQLPVDKSTFKGEIPNIPNLYPYTPFEFYIKRKLYVQDMGHVLTAYLGNLFGYECIWHAIGNPHIKIIVQRAMLESATALSKKFAIPFQNILEHIDDLLMRFGNVALGDTVERVGRDTKRRIFANGCFVEAVKLCEEENIFPIYISVGIAAGLLFNSEDEGTKGVNEKLKKEGIITILKQLCELNESDLGYNYIKNYYNLLQSNKSLDGLMNLTEGFREKEIKLKTVI